MEQWRRIQEFPNYSVSDEGRIRNDTRGAILRPSRNQMGVLQVGLTSFGEYHKRGVALLVARAFIPQPSELFDTPINLNGDRSDCRAENLMWRPRWFAIAYHKQFKEPYEFRLDGAIYDTKTSEISNSSLEAAMRYGLLEQDIVLSIANRTYVWPTYQVFGIA